MTRVRSCFLAAGAGAALVVWAEACGPAPAEPPRAPAPPPPSTPVVSSSDASLDAASAPGDAKEPPAPKMVDTSLSAPEYAELVATAPDGATLLAIHGWRALSPTDAARLDPFAGPRRDTKTSRDAGAALAEAQAFGMLGMGADARGSTVYLAVLDARHGCIEETLSFDALAAAGGTGTVHEALAALKSRAVADEIHRAWVVARRFGLRDLGAVAFGADESFVVVEANNALYVRRGQSAPFTHHPIGTSARLAASHDGSQIAFANCGSPCGGSYAPAILDVKTKEVRRFPVGNAHQFYWSNDDAALLFSYDDRSPGQYDASKVCIGRVAGSAKRATTVTCRPSGVMSTSISAASPSGAFVGLQLESRLPPVRVGANGKVIVPPPPATTPSRAFVVLEMPSGAEAYRVAASPIFPSMDDQGRVAWDDNDSPKFHMRVRVASRNAAEAVLPDARSVGFLPDGTVLVLPFDRPSDSVMSEPLHTLAEKRCGLFSVWKP